MQAESSAEELRREVLRLSSEAEALRQQMEGDAALRAKLQASLGAEQQASLHLYSVCYITAHDNGYEWVQTRRPAWRAAAGKLAAAMG